MTHMTPLIRKAGISGGYLLVFLFVLHCLFGLAYAKQPGQDNSPARKLIKVGVFPLEPLNYFDVDGKASGLYPDLIREIFRGEKWKIEFAPCNWAQCLDNLQSEEIDLMTTIAHTPERAMVMGYSKESVAEIWGQIFTFPGSGIDIFRDLKGKRVGIMRRDVNGANFLKTAKGLNVECEIVEFATHDEIFEAIAQHQIDAGVGPQHYGHLKARHYGVVGSSIIFSPFSVYFAVKKDSNYDVLARIDGQLSEWKEDRGSYYYKAIDHWMAGKEYEDVLPDWVLWIIWAVFIAIFFLFIINRTLRLQIRRRTLDLQESEDQLRQLIESVNSIILRWDKQGRVLFLNKYGLNLFGFTDGEILGQPMVGTIVPETDSSGHDLSLMIEDILENPAKFELNESENITRSGRRLSIQWTNRAITDEKGDFNELLSVGNDVTQMRAIESELRQAQKFEAIATLAGGIAHDFNNILAAILGYAELAKLGAQQGGSPVAEIKEVVDASYRAKELVQQILNFSRRTPKKRLLITPSIIVKESLKMLRSTLPTSIKMNEDITSGEEKILADPVQMQQIVVNLCTNALHAMREEHGVLQVKLAPCDLTDDDLAKEDFVTAGRFIELVVSDSGSGIDQQTKDRIFEPYFTTKSEGEGTGMGLAMVQRIIQECGGTIRVDTDEEKGTSFHLFFPVVDRLKESIAKEADKKSYPQKGTERIMVIDDEETIAQMMSSMLTSLGYSVSVFTSSEDAIEHFVADPAQFDLIITDQTMPGLTGSDVAQKVLEIRPEMPIILCTGYSAMVKKETIEKIGIKEFIMKPFGAEKLSRVIRNTLDN